MPDILERCVAHVMEQGQSEESAWGICRTTLNMKSDGSEDRMPVDITEEAMKGRIAIALQFQNGPALIKDMVVANPKGKFVNGTFKGNLSSEYFKGLVDRYKKYPRQVPIFLADEHPPANDMIDPVGWVENLSLTSDGELQARAKLFGQGAAAVGGDLVRLSSIYTVQGRDYDGTPIGEVLKHVLLNNESFIKDLNVAATQVKGEQVAACFLSALSEEATMAGKEKATGTDGSGATGEGQTGLIQDEATIAGLKEQLAAALTVQAAQEGTIKDLEASNANLREEVAALQSAPEHQLALKEIDKLKRHNLAEEVRRKVAKGVASGQFNKDFLRNKNYENDSNEVVLNWFKETSIFKGSMANLDFALATMPKKTLGQNFRSGSPSEKEEVTFTDDAKQELRRLGHDPDAVAVAMKAKDSADYATLQTKEE